MAFPTSTLCLASIGWLMSCTGSEPSSVLPDAAPPDSPAQACACHVDSTCSNQCTCDPDCPAAGDLVISEVWKISGKREIYNASTRSLDLSNVRLVDIDSFNTSVLPFPAGTRILPQQFLTNTLAGGNPDQGTLTVYLGSLVIDALDKTILVFPNPTGLSASMHVRAGFLTASNNDLASVWCFQSSGTLDGPATCN